MANASCRCHRLGYQEGPLITERSNALKGHALYYPECTVSAERVGKLVNKEILAGSGEKVSLSKRNCDFTMTDMNFDNQSLESWSLTNQTLWKSIE